MGVDGTNTAGYSYTAKIIIKNGAAFSATLKDNTASVPTDTPVTLTDGAMDIPDLPVGTYVISEVENDKTICATVNSSSHSAEEDLDNLSITVIVDDDDTEIQLITFINDYVDNSETDIAHVSVRKTFEGITSTDDIPTGFNIKAKVTATIDGSQEEFNYTLTRQSNTEQGVIFNQSHDSSGNVVWNWAISIKGMNPDAVVEVTENSYLKAGYDVVTSINPQNENGSSASYTGTVSSSTVVASLGSEEITSGSQRTFPLSDSDALAEIFVARLTQNGGALVISKEKLNLSERQIVEEKLKHMNHAQDWTKGKPVKYYSFEEANNIVFRDEQVSFNATNKTVTFLSKQWTMCGTFTLNYQPGRPADFNFVNKYTEKEVGIDIVKVDQNNRETTLKDAKFTITMLEESSKPGHIAYKMKPTTDPAEYVLRQESAATGTDGKTAFSGLKSGYYEIKETQFPAGYISTGDDTFYVKVANGVASYLAVSDDNTKAITGWDTITSTSGTDLIQVVPGTADDPETVADETVKTKFTVGNTPGTALPNTGGPGTRLFTILGSILILGAGVLLWRRRRLI